MCPFNCFEEFIKFILFESIEFVRCNFDNRLHEQVRQFEDQKGLRVEPEVPPTQHFDPIDAFVGLIDEFEW